MKARVEILSDALAQIEEADDWWRANRSAASDLFSNELNRMLQLIEEQPEIGKRFARPRFPRLRRLLLRQTRYWIYYEHVASRGVAVVRAVWSAVRGRGPRLSRP